MLLCCCHREEDRKAGRHGGPAGRPVPAAAAAVPPRPDSRQHPRERCTCARIPWAALLGSRVVSYGSPGRTKTANVRKTRGEPKKPSAARKKKKKAEHSTNLPELDSAEKAKQKKSARSAVFQLPAEPTPRFPEDLCTAAACGLPPVPRRERRLTALRGARQPARTRRTSARAAPQLHPPEPRRPHTYLRLKLLAAGASRRRRGRRRSARRRRHSRSPPGSAGPPRGEGAARGAT